jgi:hypothetical protein
MIENNDTYWAGQPAQEFIQEVHQRIRDFYDDLRDTELFYLIQKSYAAYYGGDLKDRNGSGLMFESSRLSRGGKQGEIVNFKTISETFSSTPCSLLRAISTPSCAAQPTVTTRARRRPTLVTASLTITCGRRALTASLLRP